MKALSVILLSLLIVFTGCQLPVATDAGQSGVVLVAVGSGGMIARMVIPVGNPNLPPSKILNGDYVFGGNVRVLGAFNQGSQQANVNVAAAGGTIGSATNPFFGNEYVRGTLYQQLGQQWVGPIANSFGGAVIYGVAYGGGNFVSVGATGLIEYSTTLGATWIAVVGGANPFNAANDMFSLCYGGGSFIAGNNAGRIGYSTNLGVSWALSASTPFGLGAGVVALAYGNGVAVAASSAAGLAYSIDNGVTWALAITNPLGGSGLNSITYGNGVFVGVGVANQVVVSTDGKNWTLITGVPFGNFTLYGIAYGNGVFVTCGNNNQIGYSKDNGKTWTLATNPFTASPFSVSYNFGIFQVGGLAGQTARSYDNGLTWGSLVTNPFGANIIYSIASSTSNMVAVGAAGSIATAGWNAVFSSAPEQLYVPTFTNWGVVVTTSIAWRMVANRVKIMGNFTTPAGAAGEARMSLPNGMISDAALVPNLRVAGIIISNTAAAAAFYCLIESGVGYITFGAEAAGVAGLTKQTGAALFPAGAIVSLQVEIPISGANV